MKAMDRVNLRQAAEADTAAVCQLQQEWFEEGCVYGFVPETREQVRAGMGPFCWVAEVDGRDGRDGSIIAFADGSVHTSDGLAVIPAGERYLEIDNVYVSLPYRQLGIGGQLVDALLAEAKKQGISYALLYSATKDIHPVLKFYEQHGFQSWSVQMFRRL